MSEKLLEDTVCAILEACDENLNNDVCILLEAIDGMYDICSSRSRFPKDIIEDVRRQVKHRSYYKKLELVKDINEIIKNKSLTNFSISAKILSVFRVLLGEIARDKTSRQLVYRLVGSFSEALVNTAAILARARGFPYINIIIVEVVNKKKTLASTRRPLDLTRASLIMSDTVMYVASRLLDKLERRPNIETLGPWSIMRPHPLTNPYISSLAEAKIINLGGFNPAIMVTIVFSKTPLEPGEIARIVEEVLEEYWNSVLKETLADARITASENVVVLLGDGDRITELLQEELPVAFTVTARSIATGSSARNRQVEDLISAAFSSHDKAAATKYSEFSDKYLNIVELFYSKLKTKGNPLCTNCYMRPSVVINKTSKPAIVKIKKNTEDHLSAGLRPRERLCPYHLLLRLESSRKDTVLSNTLFTKSIHKSLKPKSVYGIASFYFRLLLYYLHLIMQGNVSDELVAIKDCIINEKLGLESNLIKILNNKIDISNQITQLVHYLLRKEQHPGEPCTIINSSPRLKSYCQLLHGAEEKLDFLNLNENALRAHELLAVFSLFYPELLYTKRVENLAGIHLDQFKDIYKSLLQASNRVSSNYECLYKLSKIGPLRFTLSNYYTIIYIDADNASELFSGELKGLRGSIEASVLLLREEIDSEAINQVLFSGLPLFLGGDDIIVMVPPEDAFLVTELFYKIIESVGLNASIALQFTHNRVPLRSAILSLFESMEDSKSVFLEGREYKNSMTVSRITGSGKRVSATIPLAAFSGDISVVKQYFAGLTLISRISKKISIRRAYRTALEEAYTGRLGILLAYQELSRLIEKLESPRGQLPTDPLKIILKVMDISQGLKYRTRPGGAPKNAFEELLKASLVVLEPEIIGSSMMREWVEAGWI